MLYLKLKKSLIFVVLLLIAFVSGCANKPDTAATANPASVKQATEVDKIKKARKIVLGTSADWPPSEFHKEINGTDTIIGSDIEIAKEIAKDLGVELEIKDIAFGGLLEALQAGKVDIVLSSMVPTEERKQSVDFSEIYDKGEQCALVRTSDKDSLKTTSDLKGKTIGVQKGSLQVKLANEQIESPKLKELGKLSDLVLSLKTNKVDAVLCGAEVAKAYASKNPDITIADVTIKSSEEGTAVAMKKGSPALVTEVNKTIDRLIQNKTIDKFISDAQVQAEQ